jgi:elongation factor 1-alpha
LSEERLSSELMARAKPTLNVSTMGHVNHGKSTLVGFLLRQLNVISASEMKEIVEDAKRHKREDLTYAYILQRLPEERKRGITMVPYHYSFPTDKYDFTVIDCPGHKDFTRSMIIGTTQADAGVLVVSADEYETATGTYREDNGAWVAGQAREHAYIAKVLEIEQFIVVISKMDRVDWKEEKFQRARENVENLLGELQMTSVKPIFLPVGGEPPDHYGVNVVSNGPQLSWFHGPTFVGALNSLRPPTRAEDLPLRMPIEEELNLPGGQQVCGRIETGIVRVGDRVTLRPSRVEAEIRSIKMRDERLTAIEGSWAETKQALAGAIVSLQIKRQDKQKQQPPLKGNVVSSEENAATVAKKVDANIYVLWHPTKISKGYSPVAHIGTDYTTCVFEELKWKMPMGSTVKEEAPRFLTRGETALVSLSFAAPIVCEKQREMTRLNRVIIRDQGLTVAGGRIENVTDQLS